MDDPAPLELLGPVIIPTDDDSLFFVPVPIELVDPGFFFWGVLAQICKFNKLKVFYRHLFSVDCSLK